MTRDTQRLRLVVVGGSAQVARHVADAARRGYRVFVVSPQRPEVAGVAQVEPGAWRVTDLDDPAAIAAAFGAIAAEGPADLVLFVGSDPLPGRSAAEAAHPLEHVLDACGTLAPKRVLLAHRESTGASDPARAAVEAAEEALLAAHGGGLHGARVRFVPRPRLVLTGASGFVGRHLIEALREDFQIVAVARSSQSFCGVPAHPNVAWMQVDLCDRAAVSGLFARLRESGGAEFVVHLAAYYDFTGEPHPEYQRTNVDALRVLLEECRALRPRRFVFASSLAASEFPPAGRRLDETSPADGRHPYAVTKRRGEELLAEFAAEVPSVVVRLAAIYSDWLEYPPLFVLFERWRSDAWDRGVLGGHGAFAIPYLHVQDVQSFLLRLLATDEQLAPGEVLIASPDEPTSLRRLFERVAREDDGSLPLSPTLPRPICWAGMVGRDLFGRAFGQRPFERPWMASYIDRAMPVDARRTRARLGWAPRERLALERRLPLLLVNRQANPAEWQKRNQTVLRRERGSLHLELHARLEALEGEVLRRLAAAAVAPPEDEWGGRLAYQQLRAAVRNRDAFGFAAYCALLAERRFDQGRLFSEVDAELARLERTCLEVVWNGGPETEGVSGRRLAEIVRLELRLGRDQVEERFEQLHDHPFRRG